MKVRLGLGTGARPHSGASAHDFSLSLLTVFHSIYRQPAAGKAERRNSMYKECPYVREILHFAALVQDDG
jgi:hypothetical protein